MPFVIYTFTQLQDAVSHVLGGAPDSRAPASLIVNRALSYLVKKRPWRWRQKSMSLDFVSRANTSLTRAANVVTAVCSAHGLSPGANFRISGSESASVSFNNTFTVSTVTNVNTFTYPQTGTNEAATTAGNMIPAFCALPSDFSALISLKSAVNSFRDVRPCSPAELLEKRQFAYGASYEMWYLISWLGQASVTSEPTPILELFPAPDAALAGALVGLYYRRAPALSGATDIPDIPGEFQELLYVLVRALAISSEEEQAGADWEFFNRMESEFAADDGAAQGVVLGQLPRTLFRGQGLSQFDPNGRVRA